MSVVKTLREHQEKISWGAIILAILGALTAYWESHSGNTEADAGRTAIWQVIRADEAKTEATLTAIRVDLATLKGQLNGRGVIQISTLNTPTVTPHDYYAAPARVYENILPTNGVK